MYGAPGKGAGASRRGARNVVARILKLFNLEQWTHLAQKFYYFQEFLVQGIKLSMIHGKCLS